MNITINPAMHNSTMNVLQLDVYNNSSTNAFSATTAAANASELFLSREDIQRYLEEQQPERNYDHVTESVIVAAFSILIAFGGLGNSFVCLAVARNQKMRTPRNLFVVNLAISDLTLCVFTQIFNLHKVRLVP